MNASSQEKLIQEFLAAQTENWLEEDSRVMVKEIPAKRGEIINGLAASMIDVCQKAQLLEQKGEKGPSVYLLISFLRSNIIFNNWQYRLDVYDERFFFDSAECEGCWNMDFVFSYLQNRFTSLTQTINKGMYVNKIRDYHLNAVKVSMAEKYHSTATIITGSVIEEAVQVANSVNTMKLSNLKIAMGEYFDKSILLYDGSK